MSEIAIHAEKLGKRYRIGGPRLRYKTIRESLTSALTTPFRRTKSQKSEIIWALKDVSFEVKHGEVVGIIGRNGAGKSTLLKTLSRITEPTAGRVEVYGRVGSLLEVGTGFHPELTGRENIYLNGAILGMKRVEIERKFDEIVVFAETEKFLDTPVKHYSSGMYVRLAFAVAAHLEPEILLVDEVLAVGDAAFQQKCLGKIDEVHHQGRTVLLVSHNMTSILQLSARAIWLEAGEIAGQGDARSVVSLYLRDNRIPLGEAVFDPAAGSNGAAFIRAYVMDDSMHVRPDIPYTRSFYVGLEYQVEFPIEDLAIGFRLYNERNVATLLTGTADYPALKDKVGAPGRHCASVQIPGAWLSPGRYYAELGLWSPKIGFHQNSTNALAFDIAEADFPFETLGREVLRPTLEWDVA